MHQDQYSKGYFKYRAKALCRASKPNSDVRYTKYETVEVESTIMVLLANTRKYLEEVAKSRIILEYNRMMKDKINSDLRLKRLIGGTKWQVDLIDLTIKVYKDQLVNIEGSNDHAFE